MKIYVPIIVNCKQFLSLEGAVFQYYYEVDFDNDGLDDIMAENRLGMGKMGHEETYFYRQEKDGQYRRTFESSSGSCYNRIMRYPYSSAQSESVAEWGLCFHGSTVTFN